MQPQHFTEEFYQLIPVSYKIANIFQHEYIHVDHLLLAMLRTPCDATPFLVDIDESYLENSIKLNYAGHIVASPDPEADLPLTKDIERVIVHADAFAYSLNKKQTSSVDVLLAMIAYDNPIKELLSKKGRILETVMEECYGPDAVWPPLPEETRYDLPMDEWTIMADEFKQEDIERLYGEAVTLANYELYDEAIVLCNAALDFDHEHTGFIYLLAFSLYSQKKYDLVYPLLAKLRQYPSFASTCTLISTGIAGALGDYPSCIQQLQQQLVLTPNDPEILNNLGYYLSKTAQYAEAIPYIEKAIQVIPEMAFAHNNLGFALYKTGQTTAGTAAILHSLQLDKGNAYAYRNLGVIYRETGDNAAADEYFQLALKYKYYDLYGDEVLELMKTARNG